MEELKQTIDAAKKIHRCEFCEKIFPRAETLKKHINTVHNVQKDHTCGSCGMAFSVAGNLKRHINAVHEG